MIEYLQAIAASHEGIEVFKGIGLTGILAYVIWSDRAERRDNREADVKRSEAVKAMADAVKDLALAVLQFKGK